MAASRQTLVSGGTGFVGRAVVARLLADGHEVTVLTRKAALTDLPPGCSVVLGDMLVVESVPLAKFDVFVNCAGEVANEASMRALHVDAVRALIERMEPGRGFQWVQLSSVGVYGPRKEGIITEDDPFAPIGEYEITKAEGETVVRHMCEDRGIAYTVLRPSNVFGLGMPNRSLAQLMRSIERGIFVYFGDPGKYRMNYVPVGDVAASVAACVASDDSRKRIFNVSDSIDQVSFVELVKRELGVSRQTRRIPFALARAAARLGNHVPNMPLTPARFDALTIRSCYSTKRLESLPGFRVTVGIRKGLVEYAGSLCSRTAR